MSFLHCSMYECILKTRVMQLVCGLFSRGFAIIIFVNVFVLGVLVYNLFFLSLPVVSFYTFWFSMSIVLKNQALTTRSDLDIELYRFLKIHIFFCYYYFPHFKDSVPCWKFKINKIIQTRLFSSTLEWLRRITPICAKILLGQIKQNHYGQNCLFLSKNNIVHFYFMIHYVTISKSNIDHFLIGNNKNYH